MTCPSPPVWTGPVVLTLCIAAAALLAALGSLIWQVISWRRSGAPLRVETGWGTVATSQGTGRLVLGINVHNVGRIPTVVSQIGFQMPRWRQRRQLLVPTADVYGRPLQHPIPLGPGETTSIYLNVADTLAGLRGAGLSGRRARPFATTGHGRTYGERRNIGEMLETLDRPDVHPRTP